MAIMWREITKGNNWQFNPSENDEDWTGQRSFIQDPDGAIATADLPIPGVSNVSFTPTPNYRGGYQPSNFIARNVKYTLGAGVYGEAVGTKAQKYVVGYAAKSVSSRRFPSEQDATVSLRISTELFTLSNTANKNSAFQYEDGNAVTSGRITKPLKLLLPVATYVVSEPGYANFAAAIASGATLGTVSSTDSRWLAMGTNISEYRDDDDDELFRVERTYSYKRFPGTNFADGIVDVDKGWNMVWNPDDQKFYLTNPRIYATSVFSDVMPVIP